jgi:UDP-N-acetylmuramoyl-tripeptide--D-alanyl-D-alanine ligase
VEIGSNSEGVTFRSGDTLYRTLLTGRHAISNILAGLAVARVFDIDESRLREAVSSLQPGRMRGETLECNGVRIVNDCYNSNPEAARSMLDVLCEMPAQRRIAVLGEMLELGRLAEPLHRDVGGYAARCGISVLVGIRGEARAFVKGAIEAGLRQDAAYFFETPEKAGEWLREFTRPGDAILFKGSRGVRVEKALDTLLERACR